MELYAVATVGHKGQRGNKGQRELCQGTESFVKGQRELCCRTDKGQRELCCRCNGRKQCEKRGGGGRRRRRRRKVYSKLTPGPALAHGVSRRGAQGQQAAGHRVSRR